MMKHLWAPWRIEYILGPRDGECFLCQKPKENRDADNFILFRGERNFVILNNYPYNPGHLLVAPFSHLASLDALDSQELLEHFQIVSRCVRLLQEVLGPEGFNIGLNLGKVAGAGLRGHLHTHIVPRWSADTNFMTVVDEVRVVPEALRATYERLKNHL